MPRASVHLVALLELCLAAGLAAQQGSSAVPPVAAGGQSPSFTSANRTVAVYSTVTGPDGRLVTDLTEKDFTVADEGKPQELTLFSNDIQPITIVMLLDRSGGMKMNFDLEQHAAEAFVRAMLPADRARIGSFGKYIQIDPDDFTSDRDKLLKILRDDLQSDGPTPLWNAVDKGIDKLAIEPGRRVILVFTDGVDKPLDFTKKGRSLKDVMERAEKESVMVYAVGLAGQNGMPTPMSGGMRGGDPRGRGVFGPGGGGVGGIGIPGGGGGAGGPFGGGSRGGRNSGRDVAGLEGPDEGLPKIAAATGGGYFELQSARDLATTFSRVAEELHHQYALGFAPQKLDNKMHDLTVKLSRSDLTARARKRYYASKTSSGL